jgi:hypothetical protein
MIIRAAKKVNIPKRFWLSTLVFFRLAKANKHPQGPHRDTACARARLFIFARRTTARTFYKSRHVLILPCSKPVFQEALSGVHVRPAGG